MEVEREANLKQEGRSGENGCLKREIRSTQRKTLYSSQFCCFIKVMSNFSYEIHIRRHHCRYILTAVGHIENNYLDYKSNENVMQLWLVLTIHRFYICENSYSLKFISNPQSNSPAVSVVIHRRVCAKKQNYFAFSHCTFPSEYDQGNNSAFFFQLSYS